MLLNPLELNVIKPLMTLVENHTTHLALTVSVTEGRTVTMELSAAGILIRATYPDAIPALEFYRTPQGLAQAYGVGVQRIVSFKPEN